MAISKTKVILFRGRAGVGKSTISNAYSQRFNIPILRKDDFYDASAKYVEDHTLRNKISYDSLFKILESNRGLVASLILDFPFWKEEEILNFKNWCTQHSINLVSCLVICSDKEVWKQRFNKRSTNPTPNQIITDFDELEKYYGDLGVKPIKGEIVIDSINSTDDLLLEISAYISKF